MLTSNDYKELAARCTELASESSEPTVAEALRALASDYLARGGQRCADHEDRGDSANYRKLAEHKIGPQRGIATTMAATNKCLAESNKSRTGREATKKRET
jgi:hypothetical protein